ncbi:Pkinase-domain-containing protein [Polyporus arcularius HHB13444]|uniref:non-specific serine/threonine protein kinase n=1 Tax=Polyporus arcularius HHB13444 TaxID=1314778 RepID=A0A5C3P7P6_9APHY|nr:Pkinase-domain-containing protein [Polyporus arcularius HHB13444]
MNDNDTTQAESEGPEGSDKPPHAQLNGTPRSRRPSGPAVATSGVPDLAHIPLPPPDSHLYAKSPGHTRKSLEEMSKTSLDKLIINGAPHVKHDSSSTTGSMTPSSSESPSPSDCESWSVPSTQPPSRAPSMSAGVSGNKLAPPAAPAPQPSKPPSKKEQPPPTAPRISPTPSAGDDKASRKGPLSRPSSRPPSVHSDGGGQKFTLKDLLGAPKLVRRSSARSTASSKKSDSDRGGRSEAGGSTVSLLKKYGVCEKVAIGKGATSVVRLAHKWDRSEEKLYAVKEFRKRRKNESEKEYVKKLTAEFCISSTLHHMNVVETVDLVQDENQHWCEVMEFCPGGDLYAAIKRGGMSPSEVECCFKQILTGVAYLHSQGVAHRDIKPENLFFDMNGHLKIGDYGASTVYRLPWESTIHMSTGLCGSEPYIAPEQFLGKPYDARLVDIWACGIVYYCLHFQELPWTVAQPTDQLFAAYVSACNTPSQTACPPTINNLSPRACRPVIRKMLEPNPKMRSLIDDIIKQPWVQGIEVCHLVQKPSHQHVNAVAMSQAQLQVIP